MKKNKKKVRLEVYRDDGNDDTDGRPAVKPDIGIDVQFYDGGRGYPDTKGKWF